MPYSNFTSEDLVDKKKQLVEQINYHANKLAELEKQVEQVKSQNEEIKILNQSITNLKSEATVLGDQNNKRTAELNQLQNRKSELELENAFKDLDKFAEEQKNKVKHEFSKGKKS